MSKRTFTISLSLMCFYASVILLVILMIAISVLLSGVGPGGGGRTFLSSILSSIVVSSACIVIYLVPRFARRIRQRHQQATQIIRDKDAGTIGKGSA